MAKVLTSEEWIAEHSKLKYGASAPKVCDPYKVVTFLMTQVCTPRSNPHAEWFDLLQALWQDAQHRFSISPLHGDDNHISVRIDKTVKPQFPRFDTIHIYIDPVSFRHTHVTAIRHTTGTPTIETVWVNTRL
jgi:hypothetical protein